MFKGKEKLTNSIALAPAFMFRAFLLECPISVFFEAQGDWFLCVPLV
jgi:hypothetical protein